MKIKNVILLGEKICNFKGIKFAGDNTCKGIFSDNFKGTPARAEISAELSA